MLDPKGLYQHVIQLIFIVRNKESGLNRSILLNGVTRKSVIRLCKQYKIPVYEKNFSLKGHNSEEVFVTGTFAGIIPVTSVDNIIIGKGMRGSLTKNLQDWYGLDLENLVLQNE